ncbi:7-carboxy-7-deazaguanine synthase QueE [Novilysobacter defluvii]|uniref:7-carboxy-7-deazaguanine synthase n=1 Tax=Lysobacter defluvii IMMIB APB-9 = DSM 18482 TaxID=1385515 RepID=A0A0A0M4G2_9GAMM|nr:7-carboxy-7-deazaguanine synthase QueE [Lysobacter defluvii]KGO97955.1 7-carboxy-7-deazaguanine synthase [Lysobacter defluvii IMMIB APB-9 = DSM 18482]
MNAVDHPAAAASPERLRLTEIFLSLQGESRTIGLPTVFVRLTGCPLRCQYCDTAYAFHGGEWWDYDGILTEVARHGVRHVCVTGGEPLAQKRCPELLRRLCDAGYAVSLETSGAMDIGVVDTRVSRVLDIKTPGSGEVARNLWDNLGKLTAHDQVKFVVCSREDYEWARAVLAEHRLADTCEVLFSPSFGQVDATALADWIVADRLPVRFQVQLHKLLWNDEPGR